MPATDVLSGPQREAAKQWLADRNVTRCPVCGGDNIVPLGYLKLEMGDAHPFPSDLASRPRKVRTLGVVCVECTHLMQFVELAEARPEA